MSCEFPLSTRYDLLFTGSGSGLDTTLFARAWSRHRGAMAFGPGEPGERGTIMLPFRMQ